MYFRIILLVLAFIYINSDIFSQVNEEIVAEIGSYKISSTDLKQRYELVPFPGKIKSKNKEEIKERTLYTLIAEKVLALEAAKNGLDETQEYKDYIANIEKMNMRDILYKQEIKDKIKISSSEIDSAFEKAKYNLKVKFIFSPNYFEIQYIDSLLDNGASFDSLLSTRRENFEQKEKLEISYGSLIESAENELYKLNVGETTDPVNLREGFYILKLYSKENTRETSDEIYAKAKKVLTTRKTDEVYYNFISNFFKENTVQIDTANYKYILNQITSAIQKKYLDRGPAKEVNAYILDETSIEEIENKLEPGFLDQTFISTNELEISLRQYLQILKLELPRFKDKSERTIQNTLRVLNTNILQREILAQYAYKLKLNMHPEVLENIELWRNHYLSKKMEAKIYRSIDISEKEVNQFINSDNTFTDPTEVKLVEVLVDELETMEKVMNELGSGVELSVLAEKYSIRDSTKNNGGLINFTETNKLGEIGLRAADLNPGETFGPVKVKEGWSIFKLIEKRKAGNKKNDSKLQTYNNAKEILLTKKFDENLNEFVQDAVKNYNIEVNQNALSNINLTDINTIVYKYFGFGGKMLAVPYTQDISEWYFKMKENKKNLF